MEPCKVKKSTINNNRFLKVDEVALILGVSISKAYKIMQNLNKELEQKGKIVIAGRISRRYLEERCFY